MFGRRSSRVSADSNASLQDATADGVRGDGAWLLEPGNAPGGRVSDGATRRVSSASGHSDPSLQGVAANDAGSDSVGLHGPGNAAAGQADAGVILGDDSRAGNAMSSGLETTGALTQGALEVPNHNVDNLLPPLPHTPASPATDEAGGPAPAPCTGAVETPEVAAGVSIAAPQAAHGQVEFAGQDTRVLQVDASRAGRAARKLARKKTKLLKRQQEEAVLARVAAKVGSKPPLRTFTCAWWCDQALTLRRKQRSGSSTLQRNWVVFTASLCKVMRAMTTGGTL